VTDLHIRTSADLCQLTSDFDVTTWNIGRSGDLGQGVEVWTTWLPCHGYYETLVIDLEAVLHVGVEERSYSREAAYETHARVVTEMRATLLSKEVA
jgi:hypothetical protein